MGPYFPPFVVADMGEGFYLYLLKEQMFHRDHVCTL